MKKSLAFFITATMLCLPVLLCSQSVLYFNDFETTNWGMFEELVNGNSCYEDGIGQVALSGEQFYQGASSLRVWANQAGSVYSNHVIAQHQLYSNGLNEQYRYRTWFYLPSAAGTGETGPEFSVQSTRNVGGTNLTFTAGIQYVSNPFAPPRWNVWHNGNWVMIDPAKFSFTPANDTWYILEMDFDLAANAYLNLHVEGNGTDITVPLNQPFVNAPTGYTIAGENKGFSPATWLTLESENLWSNCSQVFMHKVFYDNVELTELSSLGVEAGTCRAVYYGYPPTQCTTLTAIATGGTLPYSFAWSNGATTAVISACPTTTTDYFVTVTDANGATATDVVKVEVVDVRCGNNLTKVNLCHNPSGNSNTLCVAQNAVPAHLAHGDYLGVCGTSSCSGNNSLVAPPAAQEPVDFHTPHISLFCEPNPFSGEIAFEFSAPEEAASADLFVLDSKGMVVDWVLKQAHVQGTQRIVWQAEELAAGVYFVRLNLAGEVHSQRIVLIQ